MKLEKWALIAEITSGAAIVATLVFLIVEIRGNSAAVRATALTSISERTQTLIWNNISNPIVLDAYSKEARGDALSTTDEFVLSQALGARMKLAEESYIAFRDGHLEEEIWLTRAELALDLLASEQNRRRWADRRESGWYLQDFVEFVDDELSTRYGE